MLGLVSATPPAAAATAFDLPGSPTLSAPVATIGLVTGVDALGTRWYGSSACSTAAGDLYGFNYAAGQLDAYAIDLEQGHLIIADYPGGASVNQIDLYRQRCDSSPQESLGRVTFPSGTGGNENWLAGAAPFVDRDGRFCLWYLEGSRCITLDASLAVSHPFSFAVLDPLIADRTQYPALPSAALDDHWNMGKPVFVPDGRTFVLGRYTWVVAPGTASVATYSVHALLEIAADGTSVMPRLGPRFIVDKLGIGGFQPELTLLTGVGQILWSSELDAIVGYPLTQFDFGEQHDVGGRANYVANGKGLVVVPLSTSGAGLVDLSPLLPRIAPQNEYSQHVLYGGAGGSLFVFTSNTIDSNVREDRQLHFDATTLDADRDGKSAAAEALAGTSDYLAGPTTPAVPEGGGYAYSVLLADRVPAAAPRADAPTLPAFPSPWICAKGSCTDAAGRAKLAGPSEHLYLTSDTKTAYFDDGVNISRLDVATGVITPLVSHQAALAASQQTPLENGPLPLMPVDATQVLVGPEVDKLVVVRAGSVTPVWDPEALFCAAGRGACAPVATGARATDESIERTRVLGYDPETQRALVWVRLVGQKQENELVVSVGIDGSSFVLAQGYDTPFRYVLEESFPAQGIAYYYHAGFAPTFYARLGSGGYLARYDSIAKPQMFIDANLRHQTAYAFGQLAGPFGAGWGTSALTFANAGDHDKQLVESVRYERGFEPGDVIAWHLYPSDGTSSLVKLGRRGGDLPILDSTLMGASRPSSLGRAANGRLCSTLLPDGTVLELTDPDAQGVPTHEQIVPGITGGVACVYDEADRLVVLADGPPRLITVDGDTRSVIALPDVKEPQRIVRGASGYRITSRKGLLTCVDPSGGTTRSALQAVAVGWARDGKLLILEGAAGTLRALDDSKACTDAGVALGTTLREIADAWATTAGCLTAILGAEVLQRPDGRIVMQLGEVETIDDECLRDAGQIPFTWNPGSHKANRLSISRHVQGGGLALVPGGTWCDPWADVLPAGEQRCDALEVYTGPNPKDPNDPTNPQADKGCRVSGASRTAGDGLLALAVGALLVMTRRRSRARS